MRLRLACLCALACVLVCAVRAAGAWHVHCNPVLGQFEMEGVDLSNVVTTGAGASDAPPHPVLEHLTLIRTVADAAEAKLDAGGGGVPSTASAEAPAEEGGATGGDSTGSGSGGGAEGDADGDTKESDLPVEAKDAEAAVAALNAVTKMCSTPAAEVVIGDPDVRSVLGSNNGVEALFHIAQCFLDHPTVLAPALRALSAAIKGHAENRKRIPPGAILLAVVAAKRYPANVDAHAAALQCTATLCVRREENKRAVHRNKLVDLVLDDLRSHRDNVVLIRDSLPVLRTLATNDDKSAAVDAKAFDVAREIVAAGAMEALFDVGHANPDHTAVLADVLFTMVTLTVNNDVCKQVNEMGGLGFITDIMIRKAEEPRVIRRATELLKKLAGNDGIKTAMCSGDASVLRQILAMVVKHMDDAKVCEQAVGCMAAMCLRSPENAAAIAANEGVSTVVQVMRLQKESEGVQRQCCLAVRNMVSRTKDLKKSLLEEGVEPLLRNARARFPYLSDHVYAALRDLDLELRGGPVPTGDDDSKDADD